MAENENGNEAPNGWVARAQTKEQREAGAPLDFVGSAWFKTFEDGNTQITVQLGKYVKDEKTGIGKRIPVKLTGLDKLLIRRKRVKEGETQG